MSLGKQSKHGDVTPSHQLVTLFLSLSLFLSHSNALSFCHYQNPKMDLIAVAFANGDLHLYRMSWQKVWSIASPQQNVLISSMAWRPDGKGTTTAFVSSRLVSFRP